MNKSYYISRKRINNRIGGFENFLGVQKFYRKIGIIAFILALLSSVIAQGQTSQDKKECVLKFEYEVQHTTDGRNNGIIYLTRLEGNGPFTIRLYDLNAGKQEFAATSVIERMPVDQKIRVFENVASSAYLIRAENGTCQQSISGLQEIEVK